MPSYHHSQQQHRPQRWEQQSLGDSQSRYENRRHSGDRHSYDILSSTHHSPAPAQPYDRRHHSNFEEHGAARVSDDMSHGRLSHSPPARPRPVPPSTRPPAHLNHQTSPHPPSSHGDYRPPTSSTTRTSTTGPPTTRTKMSTTETTSSSSRPRGYPKPLGRGNGFPLIQRGKYLRPQTVSFHIIPEQARRFRSYEIYDRHHDPVFRATPTPLCLRETKTLIDLRQNRHYPHQVNTSQRSPSSQHHRHSSPSFVLQSHQVLFSTRSSVFIQDDRGRSLLFLQKINFMKLPKIVHGFIKSKSGAAKPHLVITEDKEDGRCYTFRDRRTNEVACLERYRLTHRHEKEKRYAYKLYVSAGYDSALFVMSAVLLLDMWDD